MRWVRSADGTTIAVHEYGDPGAPVLVCVHGYPDNARLWDPVVARLGEHFRVITYDVRGAGLSDKPRRRSAYRLERLEEDFIAVLDAVAPDQPVHLLAHDWGSIQSWQFVTSERSRGRIASFVSISGPCLDHAGYFLRRSGRQRESSAGRREASSADGRYGAAGGDQAGVPVHRVDRPSVGDDMVRPLHAPRGGRRQLLRSWYIFYFQLPWLPERGWRKGWAFRAFGKLERSAGGRPAAPGERSLTDFLHGLQLYRANVVPRLLRPRPRRTDVPVLVVAPDADVFVTVALQTEAARWAPNLELRVVRGGHWLPRNDPGLVTRLTLEHTRRVASWRA